MTINMKVRRTQETEIPDLSQRLKDARGSKPLSQVARDTGISRLSLRRFEEGMVEAIAYPTLKKLEQVLGVDFGVSFNE
ncbi:helix-turn-helix domain-containing protein [Aphanizomenon flos-aquae]|uniref:helix-turn-helix domain-containing protein n=1 Tax=Aphanizomenon flos-aquae TaxID=1176 RepID=UPI0004B1514F|nr:helix-turn-helix transcriptional regulator [Aphanizomenon flos-aquae]